MTGRECSREIHQGPGAAGQPPRAAATCTGGGGALDVRGGHVRSLGLRHVQNGASGDLATSTPGLCRRWAVHLWHRLGVDVAKSPEAPFWT